MTHPVARLVLAVLSMAVASAAEAQSSGPLRVILPVGPGSGVDTIVRAAQPELSKALGGQPVVIENLPGAGGITGTAAIVKAPADGSVIGVVSNNHAVNPSVFKSLPYDSLADITPISVIGATPFVLVVNPAKVPAKTAKELQAFLKAKPGAYNYGSSGNGTIIHLAGEMFVDAVGVEVKHIPYKGVGPQVTDLIGGQIEFGVVALPAVQGHLKSGALRAIGVMGTRRVAVAARPADDGRAGIPGRRRRRLVRGGGPRQAAARAGQAHPRRLRRRVRRARRQGHDGEAAERHRADDARGRRGVLPQRAVALRRPGEEGRHQARVAAQRSRIPRCPAYTGPLIELLGRCHGPGSALR